MNDGTVKLLLRGPTSDQQLGHVRLTIPAARRRTRVDSKSSLLGELFFHQ